MDNATFLIEKRILGQLEGIEAQIKELTDQKAALQRMLVQVRREKSGIPPDARKNSINRYAVEQRIQEVLGASHNHIATLEKLYREALHIDFDLKNGTFRTYLHRMKKRGMIERVGSAKYKLKEKISK